MQQPKNAAWLVAGAFFILLSTGCGSATLQAIGTDHDGVEPGEDTQVGIAIRVKNPDGKNIYLGVYDSLPTGTLEVSKMVEFGDSDVAFYGGCAYVWNRDASTYTRWSANAAGTLAQGPTFSLQNKGVSGKQQMQVISPTRAYTYGAFDSGSRSITVWDPSAMLWSGTLEASAVGNPDSACTTTMW